MTQFALARQPEFRRDPRLAAIPRSVGAAAERVICARGDRARLKRVLDRSPMPMVIVDGERRYVEANGPARLAFRLTLAELRELRIDDLTPPHLREVLEDAWARLVGTGCVAGPYEVASPDGGRLPVAYYGLADALPGFHLIAFAPAGWSDGELLDPADWQPSEPRSSLTPRELEVLQLAAEGYSGPMIARELGISAATVSTHFEHIYAKLAVGDRAAAVAKAMRLGLIV
jgi:DNA-binding CsgD family transcriptional regulator